MLIRPPNSLRACALLAAFWFATVLVDAGEAWALDRPFYSIGPGVAEPVRRSLALCGASPSRSAQKSFEDGERGLLLARQSLVKTPMDPRAHFALFCHLGRRSEAAGVGIGTLSDLAVMQAALDRALELEPNYVDALVGKGALLIELPWFLGGDDEDGERLLRQALTLDGQFLAARDRLAAFLEQDGRAEQMPPG